MEKTTSVPESKPQPSREKPCVDNPSKPSATSGYYQKVAGLTGPELKDGLHQIIKGHRALTYGELWEALRDLDRGDDNNVLLIYDRPLRSFNKNGGNQGDWNREHLWPLAFGIGRSCIANTDRHHIRASDVRTNGDRGHLYFDETEGEDFVVRSFHVM